LDHLPHSGMVTKKLAQNPREIEKVIAGAPSVRTNTSWKVGFFVSVDPSACVSMPL
jgi:hypothetical protein